MGKAYEDFTDNLAEEVRGTYFRTRVTKTTRLWSKMQIRYFIQADLENIEEGGFEGADFG